MPAKGSPQPVRIDTFYLLGPGRTGSVSGGVVTAKDVGTPLIPRARAVIPPHAAADDYAVLIQYRAAAGTGLAYDNGLAVTYAWNGRTFHTVWNRRVIICSPRQLGKRYRSRAAKVHQ